MKITIKNRYKNSVMFEVEAESFRQAIEAKIRERANLSDADLSGAENANLVFAQTSIVPESGSFVGWKKCRENVIVKVLIPLEARRSNATGRKCRAEFVDVLEIFGANKAISQYTESATYEVGKRVTCDKWEENRFVECGGGIHFFITRIEAENY